MGSWLRSVVMRVVEIAVNSLLRLLVTIAACCHRPKLPGFHYRRGCRRRDVMGSVRSRLLLDSLDGMDVDLQI
ncbi:hypothetical protein ACLOJK_034387 [Asimina triloba]